MRISLNRYTFARAVADNAIFYNSRSEACLAIDGGSVIMEALTRNSRSIEDVLADIAQSVNIPFVRSELDFKPLIIEMAEEGLLDVVREPMQEEIAMQKMSSEVAIIDNEKNTLSEFYTKHQLLLSLHIDITSNCNERCVHCYIPGHEQKYLPYESIAEVLSDFRAMNGMTVYVSGGECMTHPDFERILRKCRELDFNIIVLSNLSLCTQRHIELLKEIGPQYVNVSLYSTKSNEHDSITTIPGSWQRTMDSILACEQAGVDIRLAAPLLRINRHAFADLKAFAVSHNMHLVPDFNIISRSNHDCSNLQYACTANELEETLRANRNIFDLGWAGICRDDPEATLCDIGRYRIHLNANGDFYPCPSMYGYVLGNLKETTLGEVWRGQKLEYLRSLRWKHMGECIRCEHRQFCEPCLAYNFNATGDMFKTIPEKCQMSSIVHSVYGD